jgi:hypothetical protein
MKTSNRNINGMQIKFRNEHISRNVIGNYENDSKGYGWLNYVGKVIYTHINHFVINGNVTVVKSETIQQRSGRLATYYIYNGVRSTSEKKIIEQILIG